jgi:NAD(P)-dependent dehydrogenase (short-subunit alcohol dehydrogenase family)
MTADGDLAGRVAVVAGAQRGIGFACASALAQAKMTVACADLPGSAVFDAPEQLAGSGHSAHAVDLAELASIDALLREVVDRHGRLDVLVSAAGHLAPQPFLETTRDAWQRTLAVNTTGNVFLAQAAARQFITQQTGGRIILFASIVGWHVVRMNNAAYCASKAALIQAARCMALELAPYDITVNTISPGSTATEMLLDVQIGGRPDAARSVIEGDAAQWRLGIPLGRLAEPADQAAMAVFLAGAGGRHITGQDFAVDGGQSTV